MQLLLLVLPDVTMLEAELYTDKVSTLSTAAVLPQQFCTSAPPHGQTPYHQADVSLQVTTLMSKHDKALAQGLVSGQQLEHLQQQVSNQGSLLRSAKEAAKASDTQEAKEQVT